MERRVKFADYVLELRHNANWFFNNLVWTDLCNSIIPLSEKKANQMALARKGNKGWISPGSELSSENSKGHPEALKQKSWNTMRIWWFPMLSRGKLHVDVFDENFAGETAEGAAELVTKVRSALNVRRMQLRNLSFFSLTGVVASTYRTVALSQLNTNRHWLTTTSKLSWETTL